MRLTASWPWLACPQQQQPLLGFPFAWPLLEVHAQLQLALHSTNGGHDIIANLCAGASGPSVMLTACHIS